MNGDTKTNQTTTLVARARHTPQPRGHSPGHAESKQTTLPGYTT